MSLGFWIYQSTVLPFKFNFLEIVSSLYQYMMDDTCAAWQNPISWFSKTSLFKAGGRGRAFTLEACTVRRSLGHFPISFSLHILKCFSIHWAILKPCLYKKNSPPKADTQHVTIIPFILLPGCFFFFFSSAWISVVWYLPWDVRFGVNKICLYFSRINYL